MQIAQARTQAQKHLSTHLIESRAKRPPAGAAVMTRWPAKQGSLVTADTPEELTEKLAKRMQATARKSSH